MAITYSGGVIYIDDGTYDWDDLMTAHDNGSWGVISQLGDRMFQTSTEIDVGIDGTNTTVFVIDDIAMHQSSIQFWIAQNAKCYWGRKTDGFPEHGSWWLMDYLGDDTIVPWNTVVADYLDCGFYFYDTIIVGSDIAARQSIGEHYEYTSDVDRFMVEAEAWNASRIIFYNGIDGTQNDFMFVGGRYATEFEGAPGAFTNIKHHHVQEAAMRIWSFSATARDVTGTFNNYDVKAANGYTATIIDSVFDETKIYHDSGAGTTTYNQKSINKKYTNAAGTAISGARITLWDNVNTQVFNITSDAQGDITEQIITIAQYVGTNTPPTPPTKTGYNPHLMKEYAYGYYMVSTTTTITDKVEESKVMVADPFITEATEATVAAYTGITINYTTEEVTISSNHTMNEIYDYCNYHIAANPQRTLDTIISTTDGRTFDLDFDFIVNTGVTVTAPNQTLSIGNSKNWTLSGTAEFTGVLIDSTQNRVWQKFTVKDEAQLPVSGARIYYEAGAGGPLTQGTVMVNTLSAGDGTYQLAVVLTADQPIQNGKIRRGTSTPHYKTTALAGTVSDTTGYSVDAIMILDE